ncbi:unnamed protein product [Ostreobium quekettii]|uniref:UTP-monosaccharide-1-phosphate uridylyltransferase n=1 Tax=Ostreobium quekettii TaxID=121088 RepID=A0A8S1IML4_9CHLO|nr:unnamed protein product [Ostreobium quekettii]|eukprot:evm.model.scf_1266.2 EVM.evm.TU.scf_1266.2   scf_1266:14605-20924(+)
MCDALSGSAHLFEPKVFELLTAVQEEDQSHLFEHWGSVDARDADKRRLAYQIVLLDQTTPGGIVSYIRRARELLRDSRDGVNPLDGYTPSVPEGVRLDFGSCEYKELQSAGATAAASAAFVLVAGGLGERLGYSGIKIALPADTARGVSFLQLYIESILALQEQAVARGQQDCELPLIIMTSDDTHKQTVKFLEENSNFGMNPGQIALLKQDKVACLSDSNAHLALDASDSFRIQTKPHGHGDVHSLIHAAGLPQKWHQQGLKWVCFFQDTNALVFNGLLPALGASVRENYAVNSLAVPRKAKEAIGAIAKLRREDGHEMTVNVEYNQLGPLLKSTISEEGDVNDDSGFSPFPGNINQLVLKVDEYARQLQSTGGIVPEFVNPKYKDESKTEFKSSTRLECMMQDYPRGLAPDAKVGFTVINQVWSTYSPVKNSPEAGRLKVAANCPSHTGTSAEADVYHSHCSMLRQLGARVAAPEAVLFNGIRVHLGPRITWSPSFALTFHELEEKLNAAELSVSQRSVLIIEGADVHIDSLKVDGALWIRCGKGAQVRMQGFNVWNAGWEWQPLDDTHPGTEQEQIRGFHVKKNETAYQDVLVAVPSQRA